MLKVSLVLFVVLQQGKSSFFLEWERPRPGGGRCPAWVLPGLEQ